MFTRHTLPIHEPFLPGLARRLLDVCGDCLPRALVLLPSTRACESLRHALLEASGSDGLLLPRVTTPGSLVDDLADRLGDTSPVDVPGDLRAAVLAPRLSTLDWLQDQPGAAAGMAEQMVRLFDELRRHELDPGDLDDGGPAAADRSRRDVARVSESWRLYRSVVPRDDLDRERDIIDAVIAADPWPGPPVQDFFVAGFSDLDLLGARLIQAVATAADTAHLFSPETGDDPLTRLFLASYSDRDAPTHPFSPSRHAASALLGTAPETLGRDSRLHRERLADLGDPADMLRPCDESLLHACADPEQESLLAAGLVVEQLRRDPRSRIAVATADRVLARRIADQLFDAGLDLDITDGDPLTVHADGRLAWTLLRTTLTGLHADPLLELLTHPHVTFGLDRTSQARRTLSFEKQVVRGRISGGGLSGLRRHAAERDAEISRLRPGTHAEMTKLVDDLAGGLAELIELATGSPAPLATHVAALRNAWAIVAPEQTFAADSDDDTLKPARRLLGDLFDDLSRISERMPPLTSADFAALLSRQLGRIQVRPLRLAHLPVQVTGLLEVRLEQYDLLVLAGLGETVFPDEPRRRTLWLGRPWREDNDLPDWRWDLGLDAELFLRLIHNGDRVAVTWSREREGQPTLPSPLIGRLLLAAPEAPATPSRIKPWRREPLDPDRIRDDQAIFADEPRARPVHGHSRPLASVTHTALKAYRECPYRFLLENGYGLREDERVLDELRKKDYGTLAHNALQRFLDPGQPGEAALRSADHPAARAALGDAVAEAFATELGHQPQHRLWAATLLAVGDDIVTTEIERARRWRVAAREADFEFDLAALRDWLEANGASPPPLPDEAAGIVFRGRLDRVDLAHDAAEVRVIDYKTGKAPATRKITGGEDLQLSVYALAVRLGRVTDVPADAALSGAFFGLKKGDVGYKRSRPHLGTKHDLVRDAVVILDTVVAMADRTRTFDLIEAETDPDQPGAPCHWCAWRGVCRVDEAVREAKEATS